MSWKNACDACGKKINPDDKFWQIRVGTGRSEKDGTLPGKIIQRTYLCKNCIGSHTFEAGA